MYGMIEKINEQISVITIYNRDKGTVLPWKVRWNGRDYTITKLGYHYRVKRGRFTHHIFTVSNATIAFKLLFDTESLYWWVQEVSDGLTA